MTCAGHVAVAALPDCLRLLVQSLRQLAIVSDAAKAEALRCLGPGLQLLLLVEDWLDDMQLLTAVLELLRLLCAISRQSQSA